MTVRKVNRWLRYHPWSYASIMGATIVAASFTAQMLLRGRIGYALTVSLILGVIGFVMFGVVTTFRRERERSHSSKS